MKKRVIIIIAAIMVMAGCAHKSKRYNLNYIHRGWKSEIMDVIDKYPQNKAHWGILVQKTNGDTILAYNSDDLFIPASTLKLVTAMAAWKMLGPDYRMPTYINTDGSIYGNTLDGNLIVTGTGDPTFDKRHWKDPEVIFRAWADSLKAKGISKISGDVIGDDDLFEELRLGSGWAWDDISFPFSAEFGPLMANNTTAEITILPPVRDDGEVTWISSLPFKYLEYKNQITLNDSMRSRVHARRMPGSNEIRLFGNFDSSAEYANKSITVPNPTLHYASLLKAVLEENGISIIGNARDIDDMEEKPQEQSELFTHYSPKLKYIISQFLHDSNNQAGEALVRHLAWRESNNGTFKEARLIVSTLLENIGISNLNYRIKDGCGLSRYNLITPEVLNKVLLYMDDEHFWHSCLSKAGEEGTLEERLAEVDAEIHAKTGSMSNINCLAGYISTSRKDMVFSIMINNYLGHQSSTELIDEIVRIIAENN